MFACVKFLGFVVLLMGCGFQSNGQRGAADGDDSMGGNGPGPGVDGGMTTTDARTCFGTGLLKLCLASPPDKTVTLPGSATPLDTGVDANCRQVVPQSDGPDLCVIAGTSVTVTGAFVAIGTRPLVLIGADTVTVTAAGVIDVSSKINPRRVGAGANTGTCATAGRGTNDAGGGGGGAGGSFGTVGGAGGTGDTNSSDSPAGMAPGGMPGAAQAPPTILRGGCSGAPGGDGADTDATHFGGAGGDGGGAVYLIAGNTITITGNVFASGAGGGVTSGGAGAEEGGGGGGAGGMIGLDAPRIQVDGRVAANGGAGGGGGGGGGGGVSAGGTSGGDGTTTSWNARAIAGQGADSGAGNGAQGTAIGVTTTLGGGGGIGGAGGGAGGLGLVWTYGNVPGTPMISPAPTKH